MVEPVWLQVRDVVLQNEIIVAETGERFFVRDNNLLASAVEAPRNHYSYGEETDPIVLACVLMRAIAQNHPFEQGNKRTAFVAAATFLLLNGAAFSPPDDPSVMADLLLDFLETDMDLDRFVERFHAAMAAPG